MATKIKLGTSGNWGVKDGGVLAYNDENNVFKAIELQSSRASGATYVGEDGLIKDAEVGVPRIDWTNGVGELLLEPQRRNVVTYSEDITQGVWQKNDTTIIASNILAPDGTNTATRLESTGANDACQFVHTGTIGINYTGSFYAKSVSGGGSTSIRVADAGSTQSITLTSEWQRFTFTASPTATTVRLGVLMGDVGSQIDVWGFQLEDGGAGVGVDYPTSYIRTSGSTVTRIADAVTGNSSLGQVINSSEGVLYFEGSALYDTQSINRNLRIQSSSSPTNEYLLFRYTTTQNRVQIVVRTGGIPQTTSQVTISDITDNNKFALKWKVNDIALWINGVEEISVSSASVPTGLDSLTYQNLFARTKDLRVYDQALTDEELQALTS